MLTFILSALAPSEKQRFYTRLYKTYYSLMKHVAYQVTNGGVNTDDIVQDTLVRLLKQYEKLRVKDESALAFYIALTTKMTAIDALRKKYRHANWSYYGEEEDFAETAADFHTPEQAVIDKEDHAGRVAAIERLPAAQRDLLLYKYVLELPNADLARIYGTTEDNIRQRLSRTRRKLCKLLEEMS